MPAALLVAVCCNKQATMHGEVSSIPSSLLHKNRSVPVSFSLHASLSNIFSKSEATATNEFLRFLLMLFIILYKVVFSLNSSSLPKNITLMLEGRSGEVGLGCRGVGVQRSQKLPFPVHCSLCFVWNTCVQQVIWPLAYDTTTISKPPRECLFIKPLINSSEIA